MLHQVLQYNFTWVPSYVSIKGTEDADFATRVAADSPETDVFDVRTADLRTAATSAILT